MVTRRLVLAYVLLGVVVWGSQQGSALWWTNYVTRVTYMKHVTHNCVFHPFTF